MSHRKKVLLRQLRQFVRPFVVRCDNFLQLMMKLLEVSEPFVANCPLMMIHRDAVNVEDEMIFRPLVFENLY